MQNLRSHLEGSYLKYEAPAPFYKKVGFLEKNLYMGSIRNVACPCGFKSPVTVGGSMRDFLKDSRFPFYCETCGIVDVNVAKDDLYCPKCESRDVKQYGIPPISEPPLINRGYVSARNYQADAKGHLCPACKNKTMEFTLSEMCFD